MGLTVKQFKPLVVGAPRSGFTLLISVIMHLRQFAPEKGSLQLSLLRHIIDHVGNHMSDSIVNAFGREGIGHDLLFNPNFRYLPGGPKWLKKDNPELACFRKYIGVRGMGDFTLVTSHPRQLLDIDPVVHSHENPGLWLSHPGYADYTKFASVRHPIGILNSAIHSINALASEYIQKFVPPEEDNDLIRQNLALYKFTDLDFFEGLVKYLASYLEDFMQHKDRYIAMRWEDLISDPVPTILRVAQAANIRVSEEFAKEVWSKLDHVNLTGHHQHNYRVGHGEVGDWRYSVTNAHIDIVRAYGIEPHMVELGYGPLEHIDPAQYTPFQKQVQEYLDRGQVYRDFPDPDLFTFAFNKSNLVSDKFPFQRYDWRTHTQVERSIFSNEAMLFRVWDAAEQAVGDLNAFLDDFLNESFENGRDDVLDTLQRKHGAALGPRLAQAMTGAKKMIQETKKNAVTLQPQAVQAQQPLDSMNREAKQVELHFYHDLADLESYLAQLVSIGRIRIRLSGRPDEINRFLDRPGVKQSGGHFLASSELRQLLGSASVQAVEGARVDAYFLFESDAEALSAALMELVDLDDGVVLAPITSHYFARRPLFLITIPKGGTHLLHELVRAFGYHEGVICPDEPVPGTWYCVEYSNSHTSARDFFVDTVRRSPFGNRDHPFVRSPAIFIYRNPLDIVVSEANYYHKPGNTAFSGYFDGRTFEERLLCLIDDPWLLGSIRDRIGNFIPWLSFPNVVPISFEELIGPNGGGGIAGQTRLIWSLQLKLHVPGNARDFGNLVFNQNSATFHAGQVGAYRNSFTQPAWEKFNALPQDFMQALGYGAGNPFPQRAEQFRRRPLKVPSIRFDETVIAVEAGCLGHNIVRYRHRYIGIPQQLGEVNLEHPSNSQILQLKLGSTLEAVKHQIYMGAEANPDEPSCCLEEGYCGYNLVSSRGLVFGIPQSLGPDGLGKASEDQLKQLFIGFDAAMVKDAIQKAIGQCSAGRV